MDIEGVEGPSEVTVIGNEVQVEHQLRDFAIAGATEFVTSILPVSGDCQASVVRTMEFLKSMLGRV